MVTYQSSFLQFHLVPKCTTDNAKTYVVLVKLLRQSVQSMEHHICPYFQGLCIFGSAPFVLFSDTAYKKGSH